MQGVRLRTGLRSVKALADDQHEAQTFFFSFSFTFSG